MKSSTYPWADAEAFEQFLRGEGFPAHQAHAITTKGFGGGGWIAGEQAQIAELVRELKMRKACLESKSIFDDVGRFFAVLPKWTNQVRLFPGEEVRDIVIVPVSPGKVTFSVEPQKGAEDASFECIISYDKFQGNSLRRDQLVLTEKKPGDEIDRGVRESLFPKVDLDQIRTYFEGLLRNLINGTTSAVFRYHEYPAGHPKRGQRQEGLFKITAINHAVRDFRQQEFERRYPTTRV